MDFVKAPVVAFKMTKGLSSTYSYAISNDKLSEMVNAEAWIASDEIKPMVPFLDLLIIIEDISYRELIL